MVIAERSVSGARTAATIAVLAAGFVVSQVVFVPLRMGLGWDEAVYVSQVSPGVPAAFFSAPRARGISVLVAPVVAWTTSTVALHLYLTLLSGAGLFVALWIWRRLVPLGVLVLAGVLFGGLWITQFYGPEAMPNLWVAFGGLAAVGCFLRSAADPGDRACLAGLGAAVACMAFMRPADAVWLVLPPVAAVLIVPGWRRPALLALIVGGLIVGGMEWIIEAFVRFGGVPARLHRSSQIEGGIGWHFAVDDQLRALDGRTLCRPCDVPWRHPVTGAWWLALPPLTAGGLVMDVRAGRTPIALLPTLCAAAVAVPYLFAIDYAAPRFLLPAYALLAIPVAGCLRRLIAGAPRPWRPVTVSLVGAGLASHLAIQYVVLAHTVNRTRANRADWAQIAADLHRLGVRPPCLLTGDHAVPIAFYARCASADIAGNNANTTIAGIAATAARMPVAVIQPPGTREPGYARKWRRYPLAHLRSMKGYRVYVSPARPGTRRRCDPSPTCAEPMRRAPTAGAAGAT